MKTYINIKAEDWQILNINVEKAKELWFNVN